MQLPWEQIVTILRLGLIGLAFLLAVLGYSLIRNEQRSSTPRPIVLKCANRFVYQCMALLILVGLLQGMERMLVRYPSPEQVTRCRDSADLLHDRRLRAEDMKNLQDAIDQFESSCSGVLREWEKKQ